MGKYRIAILASGNGTNAEEIIKYFSGHAEVEVSLVVSNNPTAQVLERTKKYSVPTLVFSKDQFKDSGTILQSLKEYRITHIVLAGFLLLIPEYLIAAFPDRIINLHPSLLPRHGGKGMYGLKVHTAVKISGDKKTGITIHLVNAHYDEGKVIFQASCNVETFQTPEEIAKCVHQLEYEHYPKVIEKWIVN
jgi:phosphoribosylglycinamide formyltransferase-1